MKYIVSGFINKNVEVSTKEFASLKKANQYIEKILDQYDFQVEESYFNNSRTNLVVNNYTRFYIEQI